MINSDSNVCQASALPGRADCPRAVTCHRRARPAIDAGRNRRPPPGVRATPRRGQPPTRGAARSRNAMIAAANSAGRPSGSGTMPPTISATSACGSAAAHARQLRVGVGILGRADQQRRHPQPRDRVVHLIRADGAVSAEPQRARRAARRRRSGRAGRAGRRDRSRRASAAARRRRRRRRRPTRRAARHGRRRRSAASRSGRVRDPLRRPRRERDRDDAAGVMADERGSLDPERVEPSSRRPPSPRSRALRQRRRVAETRRVERDRASAGGAKERQDIAILVARAGRLVQ